MTVSGALGVTAARPLAVLTASAGHVACAFGGALGVLADGVSYFWHGLEETTVAVAHATLQAPETLASAPLLQRFAGRPLHEAMPIVMVALIMGTLYFAYVVCCVPTTNASMLEVVPAIFHGTFILAIVSYHNGVVTDPGGVPDSYCEAPGVLDRIAHSLVERKKTTGDHRFCHKENKYKPDRSHFCRQLSKNVLRMDHYCPWLSNCVGHYNHKFFFLFLLYTVISTNITMFCIVQGLVNKTFPAGATVLLLQGAGMAAVLSAVLTPFFIFHCWLLSRNMTTIEFCEQKGWEKGDRCASPYDLGMFGNFRSVLGESPWLWLLPVGQPQGDGLSWHRQKLDC